MLLKSSQQGVLLQEVLPGSPAEEGGLIGSDRPGMVDGEAILIGGDIITGLDGQPINSLDNLQAALQKARPGQKVDLTVLRDGTAEQVMVTLGARPATSPTPVR